MLTAAQLRAARAMTEMTADELAAASGLSVSAIEKTELAEALADASVIERLRTIFESKGIIFLAAGDSSSGGGPGVRLSRPSHDEGIRPQNLNAANDD